MGILDARSSCDDPPPVYSPGFGRIGQGLMIPEIMSGLPRSGKLHHGIMAVFDGEQSAYTLNKSAYMRVIL
jgi:hypothetical protein